MKSNREREKRKEKRERERNKLYIIIVRLYILLYSPPHWCCSFRFVFSLSFTLLLAHIYMNIYLFILHTQILYISISLFDAFLYEINNNCGIVSE